MKGDEIKLNDWMRIFIGPVPAEFYLELVIRGLIFWLLLVVCMRILGKRMTSHLSQLELVALVSLASAIGVPMLAPDRGILPSIMIALVVVAITWVATKWSVRSKSVEKLAQGEVETLIENATMEYGTMQDARISRERLFAHLRSEGIQHLGEVRRVYLEPRGVFTLIRNQEPGPGLMILPEWDKDFVSERLNVTGVWVCKNCGVKKRQNVGSNERCFKCKQKDGWVKAVTSEQVA